MGFCSVELLPSPKSHCHDVGLPPDKSLKDTVPEQVAVTFEAKAAAGAPGNTVKVTGTSMIGFWGSLVIIEIVLS